MKEIIKKIIVGILAVTIVVGAAVYRFVIVPKQREESANADVTVSDTTAETEEASKEETTKKKKDKNKETTEGESTEASSDAEVVTEEDTSAEATTSEQAETQVATTKPTTTKAPAEDKEDTPATTKPTTTKPQPTTEEEIIDDTPVDENMIDQYQQLFKSGKFLMKVKDPDLGDVTMAMNGNQMYIDASMEGISLKMIYNGVNKKGKAIEGWSVVIPDMGIYSPMPEEMVGDMNVEELTKDFATEDDNIEYTVDAEEITYNGETILVTTESCVDENGNTTKYYFNGDELIRSDSISPSGAVSTTEFSEISADVPDSLFQITHTKVDISWLLNSLG